MSAEKYSRVLNRITVGAAGAVFLYYFVYLLLCLTGFDTRIMSLFALFVMAVAGLPILFRERLKKWLKRAFVPLQIFFTVLLCVYLVTLIGFWCYIGMDSAKTPAKYKTEAAVSGDTGAGTVIIVFGCRVYGYTPGDTLKPRLDAALELLESLPDAVCIVSGGQGPNESVPEAVAMKQYLMDHGIDGARILTEADSHTTSENVRFTKELLTEQGLENYRRIGVSTAFHLPRIEMLGSRYGLPMEVCAAPSPNFGMYYVSMVREYLSYIKMMLFDQAVIAIT